MNYSDATVKLGNKSERKIAYQTVLRRKDDKTLAVRHHKTDIVLIHDNGTYTLNTGGHRTATTKQRLSRYSTARVFQKNFEWYCNGYTYFDGIKLDSAGKVLNADPMLKIRGKDK